MCSSDLSRQFSKLISTAETGWSSSRHAIKTIIELDTASERLDNRSLVEGVVRHGLAAVGLSKALELADCTTSALETGLSDESMIWLPCSFP